MRAHEARATRSGEMSALNDQLRAKRKGRPFDLQAEYYKAKGRPAVKEGMAPKVLIPAAGIAALGGVGAGHQLGKRLGADRFAQEKRTRWDKSHQAGRAWWLRTQASTLHRGQPFNVQAEYNKMVRDPTYSPKMNTP